MERGTGQVEAAGASAHRGSVLGALAAPRGTLTFGMMVWFLCGERIRKEQEGQEEPWVRPGQTPRGLGVRLSGQR